MIRGIIRESIIFISFASVLFFTPSMSATAVADSERPRSFSNKDLETYKEPSGSQRELQALESGISDVKKTRVQDSKEDKEKEYWCRRAAPQRRKIQQLTEEVGLKERELTEENSGPGRKKVRTLNRSLAKARKHLKDAEGKFADLEDEAYRKGIPMGWLRCQFE